MLSVTCEIPNGYMLPSILQLWLQSKWEGERLCIVSTWCDEFLWNTAAARRKGTTGVHANSVMLEPCKHSLNKLVLLLCLSRLFDQTKLQFLLSNFSSWGIPSENKWRQMFQERPVFWITRVYTMGNFSTFNLFGFMSQRGTGYHMTRLRHSFFGLKGIRCGLKSSY